MYECYFLTVPFGADYKHIVSFSNETEQINAFIKIAGAHFTNINVIVKDTDFVIKGKIKDFYKYNYLMYREDGGKWFFSFITNSKYDVINGTKISHKIDVFQTYQFSITYYDTYIERAHISKSDDKIGEWVAKEPMTFSPSYVSNLGAFNNLDWRVAWVLHTTSAKKNDGTGYVYGGIINGDDSNSEYLYLITDTNGMKDIIDKYLNSDNIFMTDHTGDFIGMYAIPRWVLRSFNGYSTGQISNYYESVTDNVEINTNKLPCGYTPRNKKMLTSLCRAFVLYNHIGFQQPLKPELINGDSLSLTVKGSTSATNSFAISIDNYNDKTKQYTTIPYHAETRVVFDRNVGLNKSLSILNSAAGVVSSGVSLAGGIAGASVGATVGGAVGMVNAGASMVDAFAEKGVSVGSQNDLYQMREEFSKLLVADCSPLYNECKMIDDFLDAYGYQINEHLPLNNYINNRSKYNYLKCKDVNIKVNACSNDESTLKNIFNNGVTIWHGLSNYGDYDNNN